MIKLPTRIKKVLFFSGGRTSGYMLWLMKEKYPDFNNRFIVCFCNTGKERNETLEFVHEVEIKFGVKIVWIEYDRILAKNITPGIFPTELRNKNLIKASANNEETHWFRIVDFKSASRKGEPFDKLLSWTSSLPNVVSRSCSAQLKIRSVMRYLFSIGIKRYAPYIGIRKDEQVRSIQILAYCNKFEYPVFPLCELNKTKNDIDKFWSEQTFNLMLENYEGNCDLCFLKAKWKRIKLIRDNPGMVNWWKAWEFKKRECGTGGTFRLNESYSKLEEIANEPTLFDNLNNEDDIACSCAEKAFVKDEICDL